MSHNYPYRRPPTDSDLRPDPGPYSSSDRRHASPDRTEFYRPPQESFSSPYPSSSSSSSSRGAQWSQDGALSILSSCGLEPSDLALLAELPEDVLTVESLPHVLQQIKGKRGTVKPFPSAAPSPSSSSSSSYPHSSARRPAGDWNHPRNQPVQYPMDHLTPSPLSSDMDRWANPRTTGPVRVDQPPSSSSLSSSYVVDFHHRPGPSEYGKMGPASSQDFHRRPGPSEYGKTGRDTGSVPSQDFHHRPGPSEYGKTGRDVGPGSSHDRASFSSAGREKRTRPSRFSEAGPSDYRSAPPPEQYRPKTHEVRREPDTSSIRSSNRPGAGTVASMPSKKEALDFHGTAPSVFPYSCSLCDITVMSEKVWTKHINGPQHADGQLSLLQQFPNWDCRMETVSRADNQSETWKDEGKSAQRPEAANQNSKSQPNKKLEKKASEKSKVVCVKFPPQSVDEAYLRKLTEPFGKIVKILMFPSLAFVELGSIDQAKDLVKFHVNYPPTVNGEQMEFRISNTFNFLQSSRVVSFTPAPTGENGQSDLISVIKRFGEPLYTLFLPSTAFVEMKNAPDAQKLVDYYSSNTLRINSDVIRVCFSGEYKTLMRVPSAKRYEEETTTSTRSSSREKDDKTTESKRKRSRTRSRSRDGSTKDKRTRSRSRDRSTKDKRTRTRSRSREESQEKSSREKRSRSESKEKSNKDKKARTRSRSKEKSNKEKTASTRSRSRDRSTKEKRTRSRSRGKSREKSSTDRRTRSRSKSREKSSREKKSRSKSREKSVLPEKTEKNDAPESRTDPDPEPAPVSETKPEAEENKQPEEEEGEEEEEEEEEAESSAEESDIEGMEVIGEDGENLEDDDMDTLDDDADVEEENEEEENKREEAAERTDSPEADKEEEVKDGEAGGQEEEEEEEKPVNEKEEEEEKPVNEKEEEEEKPVNEKEEEEEKPVKEEQQQQEDEEEPDFPVDLENCITLDELGEDDQCDVEDEEVSDGSRSPSTRVLHFRNLPLRSHADAEFIGLVKDFGTAVRFFHKPPSCGFIEMSSSSEALTAVRELSSKPVTFNGSRLDVQISDEYKRLTNGCEVKVEEEEEEKEEEEDKSERRTRSSSRRSERLNKDESNRKSSKKTPEKESTSKKTQKKESRTGNKKPTEKESEARSSPEKTSPEKESVDKTESETTPDDSTDRKTKKTPEKEVVSINSPEQELSDKKIPEKESGSKKTSRTTPENESANKKSQEKEALSVGPPKHEASEEKTPEKEQDQTEETEDAAKRTSAAEKTQEKEPSSKTGQENESLKGKETRENESLPEKTRKKKKELAVSDEAETERELETSGAPGEEKTEVNETEASEEETSGPDLKDSDQTPQSEQKPADRLQDSEVKEEQQSEAAGGAEELQKPTKPVGTEFVRPVVGYFCNLCQVIYADEDEAKLQHCSTAEHYRKYQEKTGKDPWTS